MGAGRATRSSPGPRPLGQSDNEPRIRTAAFALQWVAPVLTVLHLHPPALAVVDGHVREFTGKTNRSVRRVPLRRWVVDAMEAMPRRLDSPLLWPAPRGGYVNLRNWRRRDWTPALDAAGVERRSV